MEQIKICSGEVWKLKENTEEIFGQGVVIFPYVLILNGEVEGDHIPTVSIADDFSEVAEVYQMLNVTLKPVLLADKKRWVAFHIINGVPRSCFEKRLTTAEPEFLNAVKQAVKKVLFGN